MHLGSCPAKRGVLLHRAANELLGDGQPKRGVGGNLFCQFDGCGDQLVEGDHLVDEAPFRHLVGRVEVTREGGLHGERKRNHGAKHGAAACSEEAALHLREAKARRVSGDDHVAGKGKLKATADSGTVYGGDDRLLETNGHLVRVGSVALSGGGTSA